MSQAAVSKTADRGAVPCSPANLDGYRSSHNGAVLKTDVFGLCAPIRRCKSCSIRQAKSPGALCLGAFLRGRRL